MNTELGLISRVVIDEAIVGGVRNERAAAAVEEAMICLTEQLFFPCDDELDPVELM